MSLRNNLYAPRAFERPKGWQWDAPSEALGRWSAASPQAAAGDDATISIFDVIGEDYWDGGGFTANRCAAALRAIGERPVTVKVNSPGGDMFEGLAIYNLLREHKAEVTVQVMGLAASAASVLAMAGDRIVMGRGSFLMIHNAWGLVLGNRHDMTRAAADFAEFDGAMAGIYAARTGQKREAVAAMMDAETWLNAERALADGFADALSEEEDASGAGSASGVRGDAASARRIIDSSLARAGLPRSERRRLLRDMAGMQDAAGSAMPGAGDLEPAALMGLISNMQSLTAKL